MPIVRRRFPRRRLHYLNEDVPYPSTVPVDPWEQPFPSSDVDSEQAYVMTSPLPVVKLSPDAGVDVMDVPPFPDPQPSPMGYLEGLVEYALPALALYIIMDQDASVFVRAAAGYAAYDWLTKSPVSPLNARQPNQLPMSAYLPGGCGCR